MPFPFQVHLDNIITDSQDVRWIFPKTPVNLSTTLQKMADHNGFRAENIVADLGDHITVNFPVPVASGYAPRQAEANSIESYHVKRFDKEHIVATFHDLGETAGTPIAAPEVRDILGSEPSQAIAVEIPTQVNEGNLAVYAYARQLEKTTEKVVVAGVDSRSRAEAHSSGEADFLSLPNGLDSYNAEFVRYKNNQLRNQNIENTVHRIARELQKGERDIEAIDKALTQNKPRRLNLFQLALEGTDRLNRQTQ
jgi:vacuolar-type H+-ATPase subunit D/Vma8